MYFILGKIIYKLTYGEHLVAWNKSFKIFNFYIRIVFQAHFAFNNKLLLGGFCQTFIGGDLVKKYTKINKNNAILFLILFK